MHRTRHVIMMTLVATALCADRAVSAAPVLTRPVAAVANPLARLATKLAGKLSGTFRPAISVVRTRPTGSSCALAVIAPQSPIPRAAVASPQQYPLPPPTLA
jgi:hypothetical protein